MLARLLENWLDSASERSYQAPFCQMLVHQGHTILHSTRHSPIELGKDIISRGPDGTIHAYQLKGNPGARLTLAEYRRIEAQLHQLVSLPVSGYPSPDGKWHESYLVTNGQVEEEARLAIDLFNTGQSRLGHPGRLALIQRGDLISSCTAMGTSLWPTEIGHSQVLMSTLAANGSALLNVTTWDKLLRPVLGLDDGAPESFSRDELVRRTTSAALMTSVALTRYSEVNNHYAIVQAWVIYGCYIVAAMARYSVESSSLRGSIEIARREIQDRLNLLASEALDTELSISSHFESYFVGARQTLVLALVAAACIWNEHTEWPTFLERDRVMRALATRESEICHWGEGMVPQALAYYWCRKLGSDQDEAEITVLARLVESVAKGLPSPYYDVEDVIRHRLQAFLPWLEDPIEYDDVGSYSYTLEPLFHLLVRTTRKEECQRLWPEISRRRFIWTVQSDAWRFPLFRDSGRIYGNRAPPLTKDWSQLEQEARDTSLSEVPAALHEDPLLMLMLAIVMPHRATPAVIRRLGWQLAPKGTGVPPAQ